MVLSARFANVPPRLILECFAQCQKSAQWFQTRKFTGSQDHTERYSVSVTGERCYLLPDAVILGLCHTVWQFQTSCNAHQKSLNGEEKDRKEGGAESQTKVEFMGK